MQIKKSYTYDDLLLVPKFSDIDSRADIDLSSNLGGIDMKIPIISANMKNISGHTMTRAIAQLGGVGILHRFMPIKDQCNEFALATQGIESLRKRIGCSVGVKDDDYDRLDELVGKFGCEIICVDVAHGHHENCGIMVKFIKERFPHVKIIAGNVATAQGAKYLWENGADIIKCGIGGGSLCTTRIETGNGVPNITALESIHNFREEVRLSKKLDSWPFGLIADGGIRRAGDIVKALCFADAVMLGNILAGSDEAPGEIVTINGATYKQYNGSSTHKSNHVEGIMAYVPMKGPIKPIIEKLIEGIRSGCSYQGVDNLIDLKECPEFVEVSNAGIIENNPHDVIINK